MSKVVESIGDRQWRWLLDRYAEGYQLKDIAAWIGVHPRTISRNWEKLRLRVMDPEELVPLNERREEFYSLAEED